MRAKVTGWTDAGQASAFRDEHGVEWRYVLDAADGTVAVESAERAGIFTWEDALDEGELIVCRDGRTYGVNSADEYIVRGGEWVENEVEDEGLSPEVEEVVEDILAVADSVHGLGEEVFACWALGACYARVAKLEALGAPAAILDHQRQVLARRQAEVRDRAVAEVKAAAARRGATP